MSGCGIAVGSALLIALLGIVELLFRPAGASGATLAFLFTVAVALALGYGLRRLFGGDE
jgi:hypothetical protein